MKKLKKIALIGYGKMGQMIEAIAEKKGVKVVRIHPSAKDKNFQTINKESLKGVSVAIDFSLPEVAVSNIEEVVALGVPLVVGTTGWYKNLKKVEATVKKSKGQVVFGSNFSVGMNLFFKVLKESSHLISQFDEYEVSGFEIHHSQKKDNPSGTALKLADVIESEYEKRVKKKSTMVNFVGIRVGNEPGTHTVLFDSPVDTLEFTHRARSRTGFAQGALLAAAWIQKQKSGLYSFEDHFEEMST